MPVQCRDDTFIPGDILHLLIHSVVNVLLQVPMGDLPRDPSTAGGEYGRMRGEHGTESTSLMLSSADDVSDRRESSGGARLPDMVRTRGEPQGSSQPLSTVWADL